MTLYGAAKALANPLREAGTTVVALTDDSNGTVSETLADIKTLAVHPTVYSESEIEAIRDSIANAVASLADKVSDMITHLNDGR